MLLSLLPFQQAVTNTGHRQKPGHKHTKQKLNRARCLWKLGVLCCALGRTLCTWAHTLHTAAYPLLALRCTPYIAVYPLLHCGVHSHLYTAAYSPIALRCDLPPFALRCVVFCAQVQRVRPMLFSFVFCDCIFIFLCYLGKALRMETGDFVAVRAYYSLVLYGTTGGEDFVHCIMGVAWEI